MERKHYFLILGTVCLGLLVGSGVFALSGGQAEKFLVSKEAAPVSLTPLEEAQKDYAGVAITYQFGDQSESSTAAASSPGSEPMPTARSPLTRSRFVPSSKNWPTNTIRPIRRGRSTLPAVRTSRSAKAITAGASTRKRKRPTC